MADGPICRAPEDACRRGRSMGRPHEIAKVMNLPIRSILALSILVIVLAACGTTVGAPSEPAASPTAEPSVEPTAEPTQSPLEAPAEPTEPAAEKRDVAGTITVAEAAFSGPGGTIQEALDNGPSGTTRRW